MVAGEAVLGERAGGVVVGRRGAEDGEDDGDAAADGLAAVEGGGTAEPEALGAAVFPRDDGCAVEEDGDAVAGGEGGGDAVAVGVDDGLRACRGGGDGGGFVGSVCSGYPIRESVSSSF